MKEHKLIEQAILTIDKYNMLTAGEQVLVGLSGGPDSVCLLYLLDTIKDRYRLGIHAVYVNHNLRPEEVPSEIEFCKDICKKLHVSFTVSSVEPRLYAKEHSMNLQEAARDLRYRTFDEIAYQINANKIALAHNADDQAETMLMRLIRGTGPAGLAGIPPRRGKIIRPLIETERELIEDFLDSKGIDYIIDSSNLKKDYLRNTIRLSIMPQLKKINPNLINTFLTTSSILQEEERYFEIIVTKTLMKLISRKTDKRIEMFLSPMETMDIVILRRVLRRAIDETEGLRGISFIHIEDIIHLIKDGRPGNRIYLPKGIRAIRDYSLLVITSEPHLRIAEYELQPPGEAVIKGAGIVIKAYYVDNAKEKVNGRSTVILDADMLKFPLKIRPRENGDFFYPIGFGKRKKIQDFFVDEKVPRDERDSIPIILSGDEIVFIVGYRADDRFKVTENTKKFLKIDILKGRF